MVLEEREGMPGHYRVNPAWYIQTTDMVKDEFKWSRFVENNYVEGRGFLTACKSRLDIRGFKQIEGGGFEPVENDAFIQDILAVMVPDGMTLFHYSPEKCLEYVTTGISDIMFGELPERFQAMYYNTP